VIYHRYLPHLMGVLPISRKAFSSIASGSHVWEFRVEFAISNQRQALFNAMAS